jgi:hypothetical protein
MKVRVFGLPLLMFLAIGALSSSTRRRDESLCKPSSGTATRMVARLQAMATSTAPAVTALRDSAKLPAIASTDVVLLADTTVCRRTSEVFRHVRFGADTGVLESVHVIRYGTTRYVASNLRPIGEWVNWTVLDTSFTILDGLSQ